MLFHYGCLELERFKSVTLILPCLFYHFCGFPASIPRASGLGTPTRNPPSLVQMCVVAIRVVLKDVLRVAPRVVPQVVPRVVQLVPAGSPSDDTSTDGGSASILRQLSSDFHFPFIFLTSLPLWMEFYWPNLCRRCKSLPFSFWWQIALHLHFQSPSHMSLLPSVTLVTLATSVTLS